MFQGGEERGRMDYTLFSGTKGLAPSCSRGKRAEVGDRNRGGEVAENC